MTHMVVVDYPYYTVKRFFISVEEAQNFKPSFTFGSLYHKVLNKRIYELKDYVNDTKYTINFDAKI